MASNESDFNHQLAIKLSRVLNIVNPNDLLAQRVTDIAKTNTVDNFTKGSVDQPSIFHALLILCSSRASLWQVYGLVFV